MPRRSAVTRPTGGAHDERRRVLVIHPGALGDVLQAVPALRALRRDGPIEFSGQPRLAGLLRGLGVVEAVLPFDGLGLDALFTREPAPSALVARLARFVRVISWFGASDPLYTRQLRAIVPDAVIALPVPGGESQVPVWRHLLETAGVTSRKALTPLDVPEAWQNEARRLLAGLGAAPAQPLLVIHPGAGGEWKRWPAERLAVAIAQIMRRRDARLLIHEGPADHHAVDQLSRILGMPALRLVEPDLTLLAGVLSQASAYLGGDSGVSHLAASVGAPAVILFPAATRERWAPWSPTAVALTMTDEADQADMVAVAVSERMRAPASTVG